uniref:G-protein coupled receptors family 1 profile domain-containing protein n=1 Tax=Amphimedon queenslandica TaxID=400682 RepID=A0A1X7UIS3_AMPQE
MEGNFTFTGEFSGPAVAAVLTVEMILALIANGVVLSITLYQRKSWKQSSTIFFTSLILAHLVLNLLYLPFTIIALAAGEWIFGSTDEEKKGTCAFAAWMLWSGYSVLSMTLAAISFDRFLFIVKPHLHKWFMRPWVALTLTIAIWILSAVFGTGPFINIGHYSYVDELGFCTIIGGDIRAFVVILVVCLVVGTIFVTSFWTLCFTRSYFKAQSVIAGESVYASKKKRLFGVFGSMLLIYGTYYLMETLPFFLQIFIFLPYEIYVTGYIVFCFVTIASPIIQSYFRPEIKSFLVSCCPLLFTCINLACLVISMTGSSEDHSPDSHYCC